MPQKSNSVSSQVKADCLYNCDNTTKFYNWLQKRSAFCRSGFDKFC